MRSGFIACLVTVGVALAASDKAEALTLTAADFACYQSGPCPIAGVDQTAWDLYEAVAAKDGKGNSNSSKDGKDGSVNLRADRLGVSSGDASAIDAGISGTSYVAGVSFQCPACFFETMDESAANKAESVPTSKQYLFNRGDWTGAQLWFAGSGGPPPWAGGPPPWAGGPPPWANGGGPGSSDPLSPTPEPGTMGLVMVGLALLAGPVRRLLRAERN